MSSVTLLHNPRCSKSRETLKLLEEHGIAFETREYLKSPLDESELRELFRMLNLDSVDKMMRTKEKEYKEAGLHEDGVSDDARFSAMATTPKLMERPVVIHKGKAAIGRPPQQVLDIL
ncbi:arsenate reductase (glutaredoxin) [Alteromonas halophila]|uniref:Arsenate reductase n=1 Tax=Alteromonas halophila TaxID=516698 RepID=A0A918JRF4_9ALTE|nr:arsenate reductase (glutaredoxin) [Alteromonas halophila]GGW95897.1 arsenate reductase [Alteromonas halophila]